MGTFLPLYYNFVEAARTQQHVQQRPPPNPQQQTQTINMVATALVDPNDPSKLMLTQPASTASAPLAPVYAPNFGEDEVYEDMDSGRHNA